MLPQPSFTNTRAAKRTMRAFLVGLLPLAAAHTTISVSTPTALREAITDGAHIEVANDMVIDDAFVIPAGSDVEIASTNGATIVATDGASHFRIDGKLRLENLVLTNGTAWRTSFCSYNDDGTGESCHGGSLHVDEGASLVLVDCVVANSSGYYGGGLYSLKSDVEIYRSTFKGNHMPKYAGAAIYTQEHNSLKIVESKFVSNEAPVGGALHLDGDTFIYNSEFVGNKAINHAQGWGGEGGAIWINSGGTTISGCAFVNNQADKDGPAIHVYPSIAVLTVVSTTFENNVANGATAAISYATFTASAPVIDCAASCDDPGDGSCVAVDCIGCPTSFTTDTETCDGAPCTCYSCDCASQPSFPTPAPVPAHTPTDVWWQSSTTDGAAGSALSPFFVLAAILVLVQVAD